jgi:hypothetical protein
MSSHGEKEKENERERERERERIFFSLPFFIRPLIPL